MRNSRESTGWNAGFVIGLAIFAVALILIVTLWLADDGLSRADQIASIISMLIGIVGLVQGMRQRPAAQIDQKAELALAEELSALLRKAGGLSVRDIKNELRNSRPDFSVPARHSLSAVLYGKQRPTWDLVEAIVVVCVQRAERREIALSSQDRNLEYWQHRYDELFGEARPSSGRLGVFGIAALALIVVVSISVIAFAEIDERLAPKNVTSTATGGAAHPDPSTVDGAKGGTGSPGSDAPFTTSAVQIPVVCEGGYLVTKPLSGVPAPPPANQWEEWVKWAAAADAPMGRMTHLEFTVRGRSEAAVVLTGIRVRAIQRKKPPSGVLVHPGCGGPEVFRWFAVDLDIDPPQVISKLRSIFADPNGPPQRREPVRFPYQVSLSDPETFEVLATTRECDCLWQIELLWNSGEHHGIHIVEVDGKPAQFRTVGTLNARAECIDTLDNCGPITE